MEDMDGWETKLPTQPGSYWMRDESGGPTLYVFEVVRGKLVNGPASRLFRFDPNRHLTSAEFKKA